MANTTYISAGLTPDDVASGTTAAITGTATTATESDIRAGGKTIIITLTDDTFVTGTTSEDAVAAGISGSSSWNSEVRDNTDNTDIVLSSGDTIATVTLPAASGYEITEDDTITAIIPAASLTTSSSAVTASPTFDITAEADTTVILFRRRIEGV